MPCFPQPLVVSWDVLGKLAGSVCPGDPKAAPLVLHALPAVMGAWNLELCRALYVYLPPEFIPKALRVKLFGEGSRYVELQSDPKHQRERCPTESVAD